MTTKTPTKFRTPREGFVINGFEVQIAWDDSPDTAQSVRIVVDVHAALVINILSDPTDEWSAWDEGIFYICETVDEWQGILANGHHDGWRVL